jgi:DNA-directed RNA polymerase specialized sigma24 family protein
MLQPNPQQKEMILKVIDRIAPRYVFSYYELEDIKQESYIICCEALKKYDESRPFENFISKHLSNRLKTLIRDKYSRSSIRSEKHQELNDSKKNLMDLKSYGSPDVYYEDDLLDKLSTSEALEHIMDELSPSMRNNFHRLANGVSISSSKKQALFDRVKEILGEDW